MPLHFRNGFRHNSLGKMKLNAADSPCSLRMPQTKKPSDFRGSRVRTSEKRTGIGTQLESYELLNSKDSNCGPFWPPAH